MLFEASPHYLQSRSPDARSSNEARPGDYAKRGHASGVARESSGPGGPLSYLLPVTQAHATLSHFAPWGGRSTTPLGPTLPSLVTAREYRSYCDLLYVHQVPGHGWARRATSSRSRRHVKCSGRWLCSKQRRRLK